MSVQSIERAFAVLRTLATGSFGVTELAEQIDLPKSTVARLLSALEAEGAVTQVEQGGEYRLGQGLLDIAGATEPGRNLVATVRPWLLALSEDLGEAAGLSIVRDRHVYYLDHAVPETDVMVRDWTGDTLPLQSVPSGMAMLAGWSDADLDDFLRLPLEPNRSANASRPSAAWVMRGGTRRGSTASTPSRWRSATVKDSRSRGCTSTGPPTDSLTPNAPTTSASS